MARKMRMARKLSLTRIHIVPNNDEREHTPENCWCKPTVNEDGNVEHHAQDGREEYEEAYGEGLPNKGWLVMEENE